MSLERASCEMMYLDNNATTRPLPEVVRAVAEALEEEWANPSSVHRAGQSARRVVELARQQVAGLIGAQPRDLMFTSGATESIDLAIRGVLGARPAAAGAEPPVIVSSAIEHEAVRGTVEALVRSGAARVRHLPLLTGGAVDAAALPAMLEREPAALVSVQWANNETGMVQPVERIGAVCRARGVPFHCDATQWVGKMPTDVRAVPIDLLSFSAHKLHGPKGVGALWARRGVRLRPTIHGTQEQERRGGTENTPGIAGFGAAARWAAGWVADATRRDGQRALRDRFEARVMALCPGAVVNGHAAAGEEARLWNTTNIGFPNLEAEALLLLMSERGVYASAGAACSSGSLEPSPVLLAMGVPAEVAHGSLRFSLAHDTIEAEVESAAAIVAECVAKLRGSWMPLAG